MFIAYISSMSGESWQIPQIQNIDIKSKRNDITTASFVILRQKISKKILTEWNKIEITKIDGNTEKTYFSGIIAGFKADLDSVEVRCFSELYILKRRIFLSKKNYKDVNIEKILSDIQTEVNSVENRRILGFETDFSSVFTAEFNRGKTIFDALKDLAGDAYDFDFMDGKIFFKKNIGIDRTQWEKFLLLEYSANNPVGNNIVKATAESDINQLANSIIGGKLNTSDYESRAKYGLWMDSLSGDEDVNAELEERKNPLTEYNIEPANLDFFACDVGDIVAVRIDMDNDLLSFDGSLKITEKNFKSWDIDTVTFKMSTGKIRQKNVFETISDLKNEVKNLKNKQW